MRILHALGCTIAWQHETGCSPHQCAVVHSTLEEENPMVSSGGSGRYIWQTQSKPAVDVSHVKVPCISIKLNIGQPKDDQAPFVSWHQQSQQHAKWRIAANNRWGNASQGNNERNSDKTEFWFSPVICSSFIGTVPSQPLRRWCMHSGLMVCTAALQTRGQVWGMTKACTLPYCPSTTCILMATLLVLSWHLQQHMQGSDS